MRKKVCIVGAVCNSRHGGQYGVVFINNRSITFSLKEGNKVWHGSGASSLMKGDWVCIEDIRSHGVSKSPPMMRAYSARLATEEEIEKVN